MIDPSQFSFDLAIQNLSKAFESLWTLVIAMTYVIGLGMTAKGVMMYRIFANQTFGSAQRGEIAGPMVWIIIGCSLIYLPQTMSMSMTTAFGTADTGQISELIGYTTLSSVEKWRQISGIIVSYLKLIGLIAFIRGFVILSKMGHTGAQPGSIGKGIVHIVGGVLLVNIVDTVNMLAATFGLLPN